MDGSPPKALVSSRTLPTVALQLATGDWRLATTVESMIPVVTERYMGRWAEGNPHNGDEKAKIPEYRRHNIMVQGDPRNNLRALEVRELELSRLGTFTVNQLLPRVDP